MSKYITADDMARFAADGAIYLPQVFNQSWMEKIERGINKNLANPSPYSEKLRGSTGQGYYFNDYVNWRNIEEFTDFAYNSPAAEIAASLMQSEYSVFYHEHVLTKDPDTSKATPWHHDQAYYPVDGHKNLSIWLPIDDVPFDSALKFVKGSHRWGRWFYPRKFETEKNYKLNNEEIEERTYEDVPDIEGEPDKYEILQWPCKVGDCIIFHMKTLHGAAGNSSAHLHRRILSTRWLGDDSVLARRPWTVSPPVLGGLNYGDKIQCQTFPRVWPRGQ